MRARCSGRSLGRAGSPLTFCENKRKTGKSDKVKGQEEKALTLPDSELLKPRLLVSTRTQQASFENRHVDFNRSHEELKSQSSNIRSSSLFRKLDTDWALLGKWTHVGEGETDSLYASACLTLFTRVAAFKRETSHQSHHISTADQGHLNVMHVEMRVWSVVDLRHSLWEAVAFRTCCQRRNGRTHGKLSATTSPVTHHQICLSALHCSCPVQTTGIAGDRIVVAEVRPTRWRSQIWAWSKVLHDVFDIGQNSYRLDSMMNAQPQKAFARNSIFLWIVYLFRWKRFHQQKAKHIACHRISALVTSRVNPRKIALAHPSSFEVWSRRSSVGEILLRSKHPRNIIRLQQTHRNSVHGSVADQLPTLLGNDRQHV